jgi:hypothetical protein
MGILMAFGDFLIFELVDMNPVLCASYRQSYIVKSSNAADWLASI